MNKLCAFTLGLAGSFLTACSAGVSPNASKLIPLPAVRQPAALRGASVRPGSYQLLYSFGLPPDGESPVAELLAGKNGEFYGTTTGGGIVGESGYYLGGAVYKISASGTEQVIYTFKGGNDGSSTEAGLIADNKGNLYGVTDYGGGASACAGGCGTVFELQPNGSTYTESVLHAFQGGADGSLPLATLLLQNGVLYGTTAAGGTGSCNVIYGYSGCGTVFALTPKGSGYKENILYSFQGNTGNFDGESPRGALIADNQGTLYGTTEFGGTADPLCLADASGSPTCGTVFSVTPSGKKTTLYRFKGNCSDGSNPRSALLAGQGGVFFGVTVSGGISSRNCTAGTAFELLPNAKQYAERVIYDFGSSDFSGSAPWDAAGLRSDSSGRLYGTATKGGIPSCGCGTVFELFPSGGVYGEQTLFLFPGFDGAQPNASVTLSKGNVYGTAFYGGPYNSYCTYGCGVVYKL